MSDMHDTRRLHGGGAEREPEKIKPVLATPVPRCAEVSDSGRLAWLEGEYGHLRARVTGLGDALGGVRIRNFFTVLAVCVVLLGLMWRQESNFDERIRAERAERGEMVKQVQEFYFALERVARDADKNLEGEQPEASLHRRQDETEHPAWESDDRATKPVAEARSDRDSRDEAKRWYDRMHGCPNGFGMYALPGADWDEAVISRCFDEWRVIELTSIYGERRYEHFDRVAYPIVKQMKRWSTKRFWEAGRVAEKLRKERGRNLAMDGNAIAAAAKPPRTLVELRQYDDEVIEAYNDDLRVIVVQHLPYAYGARIRVLLHLTPEHYAFARNWSRVRMRPLEDTHRNR